MNKDKVIANDSIAGTNDLSKFVSTSLVDVVTDKIRDDILLGRLEPGQKLVVRELSERYNVSHTPIKDALNRLLSEGYVEASPRKSMLVRVFSNADLIESLEARLMCDLFCAGSIVSEVGKHPEVTDMMRECITDMRQSILNNSQYESWVRFETRFHMAYMNHCGNKEIFSIYNGLDTNKATYMTYLNQCHSPLKLSSLEKNIEEHELILKALLDGDVGAFKSAVSRHLYRACEDYADSGELVARISQLKETTGKFLGE